MDLDLLRHHSDRCRKLKFSLHNKKTIIIEEKVNSVKENTNYYLSILICHLTAENTDDVTVDE